RSGRHGHRADARRAAGAARPGGVLAGAPLAPGEHPQDQGDSPLVQPELHPENERREGYGDSGQPHADEAAPGVPEAVAPAAGAASPALVAALEARGEALPPPGPSAVTAADEALRAATAQVRGPSIWQRLGEELFTWFKTLASAAVYATLIVTFGFQVARVEGQSMAPTLEDQDRLIVNKAAYKLGEPRRGDIVMLWYPVDPDKSFVKRVIAEEQDKVRIVDGRVFVNDIELDDAYR